MPINSTVILILYLTHPTILNPHISYQHHKKSIISHLPRHIIFLIKVSLKEQDLMVFQAGFSKLFLLQSVSSCRQSTTTASSRHFFKLSGKIVLFTLLEKINNPTQPNQYSPISITPILLRILEKYIVEDHIYPCLTNPLFKSRFDDQFASRPNGSPTSANLYVLLLQLFLRHLTLSIILLSSLTWPHYNLMIVFIIYSFHLKKIEPFYKIFSIKHLVPYLLILAWFKVRYWVHHLSLLMHFLLNLYIPSMK